MKLDGRVAAVTGGTRGIGKGIAEAFLREGATVVLNGRSQAKGEQALKELDAGDRAVFVPGDVTRKADVERLIDQTVSRFGRIDVLVNNAGGSSDPAPVADTTDEEWEKVLRWNLYSTFWATRAALPHMTARKYGRIINISSVEGKHGKPGIGPYVAAKHAVNGLTKSVAREVGTSGVTVNAICPGLVITDVVQETGPAAAAAMGLTYEGMVELFAQESSLKRPTTVEEVAAVAVLLASDEGGGITGAAISVDGGTAAY
ncbi:3-hydroxybutyrate dehydrogenase [Actinomadura sp. NBRC 104425]|uniref:SDR family NAD(P)-dependent oxidoreductase n=1 Tax=Actinomadura sp. NBRC 104425 TaxID=3032204 RepID=UPI0024A0277E|nr:SDR family NAD(P)-dependent oxidoreductase [Actinomadura sp. NBRC 104425]GLZ10825.1 3-hydroxybutyrate dehydrogenase [Actinomadura sp. NBRC 104425]